MFSYIRDMNVKMFHEKGEEAIVFICRSSVARKLWLSKYRSMPQLSELDVEEKNKLKVYVNDLFKGETPQFRLEACQIIFTLNQCL